MNEAQLFEKIGRQQVLLEQQDAAYGQLLNLAAGVLKGDIDPSRVMINLTARTWVMAPEGFSPELPATINGLPVCVVAPVKEPPADVNPA